MHTTPPSPRPRPARANRPPGSAWQRGALTVARYRRPAAAALCAGAALAALYLVRPPPEPTAAVLAADRDLAAGEVIAAGAVRTVRVPTALLPDGALRPGSRRAGERVAGPVRRGEVLTDARLDARPHPDDFGPGLVAAPVRLTDGGVAALLRPGQRVDLLAAGDATEGAAVRLAERAPVLEVPQAQPDAVDGALIVLALTPQQAAQLAAQTIHSHLSVTIRN
ncbi:SAF domain-containing protein [Allonocardiopsis opalescens]|uniref:Flp pilus assembly protein CpaB n=1 Tax=Allonocardiopsis opalescens TaxID=1144618 RepID=A0A2T0Q9C3_9ACTN|nr:SAF domain-containing protein [Allonocardiopsis opalescens]PRY00445.1 Flp pilus assembly protein CpaB [Allonocardiopsis opalescens]